MTPFNRFLRESWPMFIANMSTTALICAVTFRAMPFWGIGIAVSACLSTLVAYRAGMSAGQRIVRDSIEYARAYTADPKFLAEMLEKLRDKIRAEGWTKPAEEERRVN